MNERNQRLLYHITALENLESIFSHGLISRIEAENNSYLQKDVADKEIILKRRDLGILDFVPFHFFEPTPFTGRVFLYNPNTTFCAITIYRDLAKNSNFKICTAHPLSENPIAQVLDYNLGFSSIDWDSLESRDYNNEKSKNVCMAECLALSPVKPNDFHAIYVPSEEIKLSVTELANKILGDCPFHIYVGEWCTQEGQND